MKLWEVATGKCLKTWEFLTAVKRVAFSYVLSSQSAHICDTFRHGVGSEGVKLTDDSEEDDTILSITEQRSGQPSVIRIFGINREEPTKRASTLSTHTPLLPT